MAKGIHDERYRRLLAQLIVARKAAGLSQTDVAARMGWHQQHVSRYETGERRLDVVEFIDVCATIGVDAVRLLQGQIQSELNPVTAKSAPGFKK